MRFDASALEYRFRYTLHAIIFAIGFLSPWDWLLHLDAAGPNAHVWGLLSITLAKVGGRPIGSAFQAILCVGIALTLGSAMIRTWGTAYLGNTVVQDGSMHTGEQLSAVTSGPFSYVRNPLYVGTFLHAVALSLLMSFSGAVFTIFAIAILQARLMLAEEKFLAAKLGAKYERYSELVPRVLPVLKPRVRDSGAHPRWLQGVTGEVYFWGVAFAYATLGWRYQALLLIQSVVICFGIALVFMAARPRRAT